MDAAMTRGPESAQQTMPTPLGAGWGGATSTPRPKPSPCGPKVAELRSMPPPTHHPPDGMVTNHGEGLLHKAVQGSPQGPGGSSKVGGGERIWKETHAEQWMVAAGRGC